MKCPKVERHEQHWHTVMAGNIVVAGGERDGSGRLDAPASKVDAALGGGES